MLRESYERYVRPRHSCRPNWDKRFLLLWGAIIIGLLVLVLCAPCWLIVLIACAALCCMYFYFTKWKHHHKK